jgi:hypothetical protein
MSNRNIQEGNVAVDFFLDLDVDANEEMDEDDDVRGAFFFFRFLATSAHCATELLTPGRGHATR